MKPHLLGAGLALCCTTAFGAPATWTFTYTGFYDVEAQAFDPAATLSGSFTGEDLDQDGILVLSELDALLVSPLNSPSSMIGCADAYPYYQSCALERFSYSAADGLDVKGWVHISDENSRAYGHIEVDSGQSWFYESGSTRIGGGVFLEAWQWTPRTTLEIVSPVPEPGQAVMLALGLAGLGAAASLRRRRVSPGRVMTLHRNRGSAIS
ncbi:PEP-CTERM sorting domain-containing protein [Massilia niastensis]|uniref:PEP-CTERM sorting domain-containing protein n=1 Tax=Massilia niastensis TaxID=544911 RepID=UPI00036F1E94|nr:PEP-CTERM sorting domain-containing protein [Massilia niastensis]